MTVRMYGFSIWLWGYVCGVCYPHLTSSNFHSVAVLSGVIFHSSMYVHTYVRMYMYVYKYARNYVYFCVANEVINDPIL